MDEIMQKGFALVIVLVGVLVLITIATGAYYLQSKEALLHFGKSQAPKSQNQIISQSPLLVSPAPTGTDETVYTEETRSANWKTYTNNDLSFKYPSTWPEVVTGVVITSNSPKVRLVVVPKDSTLMNECMEETGEETKNGLVVKRFKRVTTGAMCSTSDSSPREIWIIPSKDAYSPGISYEYSATESQQAEKIFNQILSTFKFTN